MEITAIYGESGTGKSTSALSYAHEHQIEAIIDDGLLIMGGKKIAGISAKFEKNTLTAVKRAIFLDDEHCEAVKTAIMAHQIKSLLIIGTSKKMTQRIAERLQIGDINQYVNIQEVRSEEEILLARYVRNISGKHTMPIPQSEVEQNFFKRMIQKGRVILSSKKEKIGETTLVTPDFHGQSIFIDARVYEQVIFHITSEFSHTNKVHRITFRFTDTFPIVHVELSVKAPVTYSVVDEMQNLQKQIQDAFFTSFSLKLTTIRIVVRGVQK